MGRSIRYGWSICGGTLGMDSALSMRGRSLKYHSTGPGIVESTGQFTTSRNKLFCLASYFCTLVRH